MVQRFLEVDIERTIYTSVNIVVDDEDEKYKNLFKDGKLAGCSKALDEAAHEAANEIVDKYDWETDEDNTDVVGIKIISEEEASHYTIWDAKNNEILD